jgi:hypothetical protein
LGCNFFGYRIGGSGVWIHGHRCGRGGNREIPVLYLPGGLPNFLHYGHDGRQKNAITQDRSVKTMSAWETARWTPAALRVLRQKSLVTAAFGLKFLVRRLA